MNVISKTAALKIDAMLLVFRARLKSVFSGKAPAKPMSPQVVAIANFTTNIGDMIMTTPVIHAVKAAYPEARVVVVGGNKNREIVAGNPDIDTYISSSDFSNALSELKRLKPDIGIAMNPSPHELGLLYLADATGISVLKHPAFSSRAFRALSTLVSTVPYEEGKYVPSEYLKLLAPFGIKVSDTRKHLAVSDAARGKVRKDLEAAGLIAGAPFVVFAPGAGQAFREWPPEKFSQVARYAHETLKAGIAIAGGPGDKSIAEKFKTALPGIPVFDGTRQSLEELKALVSLSRAVVSNDSGIAYIAEAFDVPSVIVVGVSDANEHPKGSPLARVVVPKEQMLTVHSLTSNVDTVNHVQARKQLDSITSSEVIAELGSIFNAS